MAQISAKGVSKYTVLRVQSTCCRAKKNKTNFTFGHYYFFFLQHFVSSILYYYLRLNRRPTTTQQKHLKCAYLYVTEIISSTSRANEFQFKFVSVFFFFFFECIFSLR